MRRPFVTPRLCRSAKGGTNWPAGRGAIALGSAALLLAACGSSSSPSGSSPGGSKTSSGSYVIGVDDYLSGPLAFYGQSGLQRDQAAVNYVNAHGGINGHTVKLATADAGAPGSNASSAAVQLIEADHVNAIEGLTISNDCGAVAQLAAAHSVPEICISTPTPDLQPIHQYVFGLNPVEVEEAPSAVSFAQNTLKLPAGATFASIVDGDAGAEGFAALAAKEMTQAGYKQVDAEVIPLTNVSAAAEIAKLVQADPRFVLAEESGPFYLPTVKALRAAGNNAPIIGTAGSLEYTNFTSIKDPGLYGLQTANLVTSTSPSGSGIAQFVAAMATVGQTTPDTINGVDGSVAYLGSLALFQGLSTCGYPCGGSALSSALDHVSLTAPGLIDGNYGWSSSSHVLFQNMSIWKYDTSAAAPVAVARELQLGPISN